ncbi:hypothetical protein DKT68_21395 [Micromonospora acroterricola]|uniref:LppX_LprAFG lipoprotein n=1 Tax=Micromonospora acroterricola TaxID=2202421 RepID=A0A317D2E3_9ACTN|nr:hypothetical protein [Micromonospora acroterricola]PWR06763.1 hypothetical protein DKT68_21395 [Micromonospora acroterricola]
MRRLIPTISIALAVALVAGCGPSSGDTAAAPSAPATSKADPVTTIRQAMDRSLAGTVTMDASVKAGNQSITLSGKMDPASKAIQVTGNAPEPMEARLIGDAAYIKSDSLEGEKPWMKIDLSKLRPGSSLRQSFDLKAQTGIIGGVVSAQEVGEGRYSGTADLGKAAEAASTDGGMREGIESSAKLAKDPKAIPFEATVDGEGRLTALSYTIATKTLGDLVTDMRMSGFGDKVSVTAPPANETESASEEMYKFL